MPSIRHRASATHAGPLLRGTDADEPFTPDFKEKKGKLSGKDTSLALAAVACFLILGLSAGYFLLHHQHRRVIVNIVQGSLANRFVQNGEDHAVMIQSQGPLRFVTVLMPSVVNPPGRLKRLHAITETWGSTAKALYVVHNVSEFPDLAGEKIISIDSVDVSPHSSYPKLLLVPPKMSPDAGVARLNYVIRTVFEKINPDFAFFVNDHTYVIPEHLCTYLLDQDPGIVLYAGHALRQDHDYFNSGAAGYILSRNSMKGLVEKWDEKNETCLVKNGQEWLQGNPGLVTAKCLIHVLQAPPIDTREEGKWHRFHAFGIVRSVAGKVDQWYINKHQDMDKILGTDSSYTTLLNGTDCCSKETVSFHYVEHFETRALFSIRQALLLNPKLPDSDLKSLIIRYWPKAPKELGGYSRGLPTDSDEVAWEQLLLVMRKISSKILIDGSEC